MNKLVFLCSILLVNFSGNPIKTYVVSDYERPLSKNVCADFNQLNTKIRDGLIPKKQALKEIQTMVPQLKKYFYENAGLNHTKTTWVFPVEGYKLRAIGGVNGSGYSSSGYDYFDGNKHGGHPAHDIFIADKNQDGLDDNSTKPVNVISVAAGIVIASETEWDDESKLRGGKYIWIYDPASNSLFYYAHNNDVFVKPCDIVKSGDKIATVGRTGLNAFKKRSPTHLHFMQLKLDNINYPRPVDCYKDLAFSLKRK